MLQLQLSVTEPLSTKQRKQRVQIQTGQNVLHLFRTFVDSGCPSGMFSSQSQHLSPLIGSNFQ
jgi:hypothetical protein